MLITDQRIALYWREYEYLKILPIFYVVKFQEYEKYVLLAEASPNFTNLSSSCALTKTKYGGSKSFSTIFLVSGQQSADHYTVA